MKQIKLIGEREFVLEEVPVPDVGPDEVLIEVETCGICGSDIHSYKGEHPFVDPPIVLGHEYSGIVKQIGSDVSEIKIDDRVTSELVINCGSCYNCRKGRYQLCKNGKHLGNVGKNGAMADFLTMKADKIHILPDNISPIEGAMVEPAAVGVHAVRKSNFTVGDTALVIGAGVIGNLTAQILSEAGAKKVVVAELLPGRIEKAREVGLECVINSGDVDITNWIRNNIGTENIDLIFDCVGSEPTINLAIENARKHSQIMLVGVPGQETTLNMAFVQDRELNITGCLQYLREDFDRAINFIVNETINVRKLVTDIYNFLDYETAFELAIDREKMRQGLMKVMLKSGEIENESFKTI